MPLETAASPVSHRIEWVSFFSSTRNAMQNIPVADGRGDMYIHQIVGGSPDGEKIVVLSGYGAGAGFFFKNVGFLTQQFQMHLVDWLGTGLSGRPAFRAKTREEAEAFFVDSLREWARRTGETALLCPSGGRKRRGCDPTPDAGMDKAPFILVGHSLGGYLAATYARQYPEQVKHLVLIGPAGEAPIAA